MPNRALEAVSRIQIAEAYLDGLTAENLSGYRAHAKAQLAKARLALVPPPPPAAVTATPIDVC
ncbi:MAG: hypothetical protein HYX52_05615 [Chloroflexi bacterium]|nr:hypothetical protein [Chloroflexota bacterium]